MACQQEQTLTGVLVDVQSTDISRVDSITLRTDSGEQRTFRVAPEAARSGHASPGHLRAHMSVGDRMVVHYKDDSQGPLVVDITDA